MLTFTEFSGSPYHIGLALGKYGASPVHDTLMPSPLWESVMQWRGSDHVQTMQQLVQQRHPYIWDELQGLARGLELPPEDVFLWNCREDLPLFPPEECAAEQYIADESTTILTLAPEGPRITHNEDVDRGLAPYCGIAEFVVDQGPEFASFICPGSIPGHAFAVTDKGMAITINTVRSQNPTPGIPGTVLTRALLNTPDLSSAIQMLNDSPRSGGLHLSMAQRSGSALLSIEFNSAELSVQPVKAAALHTNHLTHDAMQDLPQIVTESSRLRLNVGTARLNETGGTEPFQILADVSGDAFPTYHDPDAGGNEMSRTVAIADIHVHADAMLWDIYEHPDEPARFRMCDAKHI